MEEKKALLIKQDDDGNVAVIGKAEGLEAEKLIEKAAESDVKIFKNAEMVNGADEIPLNIQEDKLALLASELQSFVCELDEIWNSGNTP